MDTGIFPVAPRNDPSLHLPTSNPHLVASNSHSAALPNANAASHADFQMSASHLPASHLFPSHTTTHPNASRELDLKDANRSSSMDPIRGIEQSRPRKWNTEIPHDLPHEKVFPIQIGSEMFKLSGASLSSDAPSYFSQYFQCQLKQAEENGDASAPVRTLYIDRDPVTFRDICLHLQGYHVQPRDPNHFVRLFVDAQFYNLPRLASQLNSETIHITIGDRFFQIPRDLFSEPGNSPNYFSLGFAVFFSEPSEIFPGLTHDTLLRPPAVAPPSVPNRSADTFAELLHFLKGYPVEVRSEAHRAELLRDCRYFHLKGLEQRLIRHEISYNPLRSRHEIVLRIEDVRQSGISIVGDPSPSITSSHLNLSTNHPHPNPALPPDLCGYVNYARPFADSLAHELVLEIGGSCTRLHLDPSSVMASFSGDGKARVMKLFEVIASKLGLPKEQLLGVNEGSVKVVLAEEAWVELDGEAWSGREAFEAKQLRKRQMDNLEFEVKRISGLSNITGGNEKRPAAVRKRRRHDDGLVAALDRSVREAREEEEEEEEEREIGEQEGDKDRSADSQRGEIWLVKTGQWRLRVQNVRRKELGGGNGNGSGNGSGAARAGVECVLVAVRIDAVSGERGRNKGREFLGG